MARNALGLEFGSAAQLPKRPGSVWNCLWGNALKRSPGIIRKSRVSYPGPGFLSSATWPSLQEKHYNGLNQTKPNRIPINRTYDLQFLKVLIIFFTLYGGGSARTKNGTYWWPNQRLPCNVSADNIIVLKLCFNIIIHEFARGANTTMKTSTRMRLESHVIARLSTPPNYTIFLPNSIHPKLP